MKKTLACILVTLVDAAMAQPFYLRQSLQGVDFEVQSLNEGSINEVQISTTQTLGVGSQVTVEAMGTVVGADVGDLDADGHPEVYVFVNSAGSGSYGQLIAYASNKGKSITPVHLPDLPPALAKGYMGHDEFMIGENRLLRRFPIYKEGNVNAEPTGGMRQIQYRLIPGEAGWLLETDRTFDLP